MLIKLNSVQNIASVKLKNLILLIKNEQENCSITYNCQFYPDNEESGTNLWEDLFQCGKLNNTNCI